MLIYYICFDINKSRAGKGNKGKVGKPANLESWITSLPSLTAGQSAFKVHFDWEEDVGIPGAFLIKNNHLSEFYLVSLTLEDIPNHGSIHFDCNSWIYPASKYKKDRIFFVNKVNHFHTMLSAYTEFINLRLRHG